MHASSNERAGRPKGTLIVKKPVVCDVETYINFFMIGFKSVENCTTMMFVRHEDSDRYINTDLLNRVLENHTIVTFNGRSYDMLMITAASHGASNAELKALSDLIITRNLRWWDI
jgi:uncharacterized protein YprB with RNaseH-like and TPR domain